MRTLIVFALLGATCAPLLASPPSISLQLSDPPIVVLPPIDVASYPQQLDGSGSLEYARPSRVELSPSNAGEFSIVDGKSVWRLELSVPGATDINFGFDGVHFGPAAELHIWNMKDGRVHNLGPFTAADNRRHGQLWTAPLPGDHAYLELWEPADSRQPTTFDLIHVGGGFLDLWRRSTQRPPKSHGACNIDVVCPAGDAWVDQIASTAVMSIRGFRFCTGSLINDARDSLTPYFITAFHCGVTTASAPSVVTIWNYQAEICGKQSSLDLSQVVSGSTYIAGREDVDMLLLQLDQRPPGDYGAFFSGWDRSGVIPAATIGVHHPRGDVKSISFDDDPPVLAANCILNGATDITHWQVDAWDSGTTEPGSSGSGLWDQTTGQLVGFLSGGLASCSNPSGSDCYGQFSAAWDGPAADQRLRDWLDPDGSAPLQVAGVQAPPELVVGRVSVADMCLLPAELTNGVAEPGEIVELSVELGALGADFVDVSGVLSSATAGVSLVSTFASWGQIGSGQSAVNQTPLTVRLDSAIACGQPLELTLAMSSSQGNRTLALPLSPGAEINVPEPIAIVDNGGAATPTLSQIDVPTSSILTELSVRVELIHSYLGDLVVTLEGPSGQTAVLLDRVAEGSCSNNDPHVIFSDQSAPVPDPPCTPNTADTWPTTAAQPESPLSVFAGTDIRGTWTLRVEDHAEFDQGGILSWELLPVPVVGGQCEVCQRADGDVVHTNGFEAGAPGP